MKLEYWEAIFILFDNVFSWFWKMHSDYESFSKSNCPCSKTNCSFKLYQPFTKLNIDDRNVILITFRKHGEVGTLVVGGSVNSTANVAAIFKKMLLRILSKISIMW